MASLLQTIAPQQPEAIALVTADTRLTYGEYAALVLKTAAALETIGLKPGDRLALVAENRPEYLALLLAAWELGVTTAPISPRFPAAQINQICQRLRCRHLIIPSFAAWPVEPGLTLISLDQIRAASQSHQPDRLTASAYRPLALEEPATILLTSGTTRWPKAVVHTLGNHYFSAVGSNQNIAFMRGDAWLLSLPLYHVGGLAILVRAIVGGGAVVVADLNKAPAETLGQFSLTHLSVVPTQLYRLLQDETLRHVLRRLKAILIGGSDTPPALIHQALNAGLPIHTTYGSTEMSSQITTTPPRAEPEKLFTAGRLLNYRDLMIADSGEILVKGPTLFKGYLNPAGDLEPSSGWFASGDMGRLEADGYLTILGRKDNMFISGGENICPEEIELCLKTIPGVSNALVVPVKNTEFGWRPAAFVLTEPEPLSQTALRAVLEQKLPRFKIPDYFWPWPPLETPEQLKLRRQEFIALAQEKMSAVG